MIDDKPIDLAEIRATLAAKNAPPAPEANPIADLADLQTKLTAHMVTLMAMMGERIVSLEDRIRLLETVLANHLKRRKA